MCVGVVFGTVVYREVFTFGLFKRVLRVYGCGVHIVQFTVQPKVTDAGFLSLGSLCL
jgi:hypothetical protein